MLKTRSMVLLLLSLGAGIVSGILLNNSLMMKTVEAQQNLNAKWEYCRLSVNNYGVDSSGKFSVHCAVEYFQPASIKRETITVEASNDQRGIQEGLDRAVAKLGEQGWEMFQLERREVNNRMLYYFKRIKP